MQSHLSFIDGSSFSHHEAWFLIIPMRPAVEVPKYFAPIDWQCGLPVFGEIGEKTADAQLHQVTSVLEPEFRGGGLHFLNHFKAEPDRDVSTFLHAAIV